ncbi:pre-rRNA processing protein [Dispira parvispora]|uniref:Pre-rRNA processing protein n=1 Tax=Dispira parvispora TaxID=1520584 RepID=A0A9W8ANX3_9FUNG|nr:pre-rRNA processing protein [Dispira parvispora]
MAKDSFFATNKKRKATTGKPGGGGRSQKDASESSFFTKASSNMRQRNQPKPKQEEEIALGDSDNDIGAGGIDNMDLRHEYGSDSDDADDTHESAAAKRLRLTKNYLASVQSSLRTESRTEEGAEDEEVVGVGGEFFAEDLDRELIASRLRKDALLAKGQGQRNVVDTLHWPVDINAVGNIRAHRLPVTVVAVAPNGLVAFSGSKDGTILRWDLRTGHRSVFSQGWTGNRKHRTQRKPANHQDEVFALAVSYDNKYLASGGRDKKIRIWSLATGELLRTFKHHKDAITGLAFQQSLAHDNQLYSCGLDRMVKVWNVNQLSYMDTLFGHQDAITSIAALSREQAVTTGGRDRTLRLWKFSEETQLVYRGGTHTQRSLKHQQVGVVDPQYVPHQTPTAEGSQSRRQALPFPETAMEYTQSLKVVEGSLDIVAMINEECFLTGGDSGSISLWNVKKKKPLFVHHVAHGADRDHDEVSGDSEAPSANWAQPHTPFDPLITREFSQASQVFPPLQSPRWITALAVLPYSNLFVSGSWDGHLRLWKLSDECDRFSLITTVPLPGVVNSLAFAERNSDDSETNATSVNQATRQRRSSVSSSISDNEVGDSDASQDEVPELKPSAQSKPTTNGVQSAALSRSDGKRKRRRSRKSAASATQTKVDQSAASTSPAMAAGCQLYLVAGVAQEPRLGRWLRIPGVRNGVSFIPLFTEAEYASYPAMSGSEEGRVSDDE